MLLMGEHTDTVFVSGCFDLLHSGHVAFLQEAASLGRLCVSLGSDETIYQLKGQMPVCSEEERVYMVKSLACVSEAFVARGSGNLDFASELAKVGPDKFVVNDDGHDVEKQKLCQEAGIEYVVLKRKPYANLPFRSTTSLRHHSQIPYRIDLAGGWLDQPWVSRFASGPVVTLSLEPTRVFNSRSGMASSTREKAIRMWGTRIPSGDPVMLASMLFGYDNPPGTKEVAGSQDAIGIVMPGANRLQYDGEYWPSNIESCLGDDVLDWLEHILWLVELPPRPPDFRVLDRQNVTSTAAEKLSVAAQQCWRHLLAKETQGLAEAITDSFHAQREMFPLMVPADLQEDIDQLSEQALGIKLCGAGGGGYALLVSENPIEDATAIYIQRKEKVFHD